MECGDDAMSPEFVLNGPRNGFLGWGIIIIIVSSFWIRDFFNKGLLEILRHSPRVWNYLREKNPGWEIDLRADF